MNTETLPAAIRAGAIVFVAGNAVFNDPQGIEEGVKTLRALV
jgi:pentose-5-phosphate-3-epimerase